MTQEEKELLIKDLCSRLPYNCIVSIAEGGIDGIKWADATLNSYLFYQIMEEDAWEYVKPYLRPMSSMTEEEEKVFGSFIFTEHHGWDGKTDYHEYVCIDNINKFYDWLNKNMFDHRGLIPKGLANAALEGMYNS